MANGYGDTKNPYAAKAKNTVLAASATESSVPAFRTLVASDIPSITKSKISDFSHTHGNLTNDGKLNNTASFITTDKLVLADNTGKLKLGAVTFGQQPDKFLNMVGQWQIPQTRFMGIDMTNTVVTKSSALKSSGTTTVSWTATDDCFIRWTGYSGSEATSYIDNVSIGNSSDLIPVAVGSTVKKTCTNNNTSLSIGFIAYGVKLGYGH